MMRYSAKDWLIFKGFLRIVRGYEMRRSGKERASQASYEGSIPFARSNLPRERSRVKIPD